MDGGNESNGKRMRRVAILLMGVCLIGCQPVKAEIPAPALIRAIIGESASQPLIGQVAIACGIRNRPEGLQGVYGANLGRIPSALEIRQAKQAVTLATSEYCAALIQGADMFCSDVEVCRRSWRGVTMVFIVKIKDHYFYRRLTKGKGVQ